MSATARVPYGAGRDLLIEAAIAVVSRKGLRGLTYRAVGEEAGVNNSLVAHHFGNREALLASALSGVTERAIEATQLLLFSKSEDEFVEALMANVSATPGLHLFQYEMILEAGRNPRFGPAVLRLYEDYMQAMTEGLQAFGIERNLDVVCRTTFATLDGLVLQSVAGIPDEQIRAAVRHLWESLARQRETERVP